MAERAQITSVEAIESFRANLIGFVSQMRPAVGEVGSELIRTRAWLQGDQRLHWEHELRLRHRRLEMARSELSNANLSQLNESAVLHRLAVQRAQASVAEAEAKLKALKKWNRELENLAAPLMKQVDQLHGFLAIDLVRGVAQLENILKALEAYRNVSPGHLGGPTHSTGTDESGTGLPNSEPAKTEGSP